MTTFIGGIMSPTFILHRPNDYYFWWIYHFSIGLNIPTRWFE